MSSFILFCRYEGSQVPNKTITFSFRRKWEIQKSDIIDFHNTLNLLSLKQFQYSFPSQHESLFTSFNQKRNTAVQIRVFYKGHNIWITKWKPSVYFCVWNLKTDRTVYRMNFSIRTQTEGELEIKIIRQTENTLVKLPRFSTMNN